MLECFEFSSAIDDLLDIVLNVLKIIVTFDLQCEYIILATLIYIINILVPVIKKCRKSKE